MCSISIYTYMYIHYVSLSIYRREREKVWERELEKKREGREVERIRAPYHRCASLLPLPPPPHPIFILFALVFRAHSAPQSCSRCCLSRKDHDAISDLSLLLESQRIELRSRLILVSCVGCQCVWECFFFFIGAAGKSSVQDQDERVQVEWPVPNAAQRWGVETIAS